ncbi:cation:proton antiporter [Pseudanabaena sp. PCC 6802]|uniref:cation:proton antiporter n=1 Tax=Pseudanabaena sp. PCC 6802 TaxID=118173 RepID=UPI0003467E43|nr:cation:proton antiporter [Pseudanabaena sp. PCC 6802]
MPPLAAIPIGTLPLNDPVYIFCVILLIIAIAPPIANFLKIPPLVVLIILGTILGKNVLGILDRDVAGTSTIVSALVDKGEILASERSALLKVLNQQSLLQGLERIGLLYIMLLAGLQMNLQNLQRLGVRSLVFGLLTFGVPFTTGLISGQWLTAGGLAAVLLGILYSPHTLMSYPIMSRYGIVQKEAVGVAVGGTVVTSILTLVGLSIVQAVKSGNVGTQLWINLLVLFPMLVFLCFWGLPKVSRFMLGAKEDYALGGQFIYVLSCLFIVAAGTLLLNIDSIVGAFIAGLALNRSIPFTSPLMKQIEFVGNNLFIPAFMIAVGVLCNPKIFFTNPENLGIALAVIAGAVGAKFLAAAIAGKAFSYTFAEVMVMFSLTMSRAALVLVIALYGKNVGLINDGIFNAIIVYIIVTCLASPLIADAFGKQIASQQELELAEQQAS